MAQSNERLRWAILGTSFISHTVVQAIQASSASRITAVFGRNEGRLDAFATQYGIPRRYTTIDGILDDAEVDVVYIGLPSHLHADATIKAARKGKAILSEKSLATTMKDSEEMIKVVREQGVFFLEGLMYLCHPVMHKLAEVIGSGVLGDVKSIQGHYCANIWKKANPEGRGTIYNLGCYPVSLIHWVMESAYGHGAFAAGRQSSGHGNVVTEGGVKHVRDAALVTRFANGVLATVQASDSYGNGNSFVIQGTKASLRFLTNPWLPQAGEGSNVMEIRPNGGSGEIERIEVGGDWDAFGYQVKKVEEGVRGGVKEASRPSPGWTHSLEIMGLLLEWEHSILQDW